MVVLAKWKQVESGNVTWDVVDLLPDQIRTGCDEGLFVELPDDILIPTADGKSMDEDHMVPRPNKCAVPQIWWSYQAFYNDGTFEGEQPDTIMDFFDVEKFPGKRGVHTWASVLEMALFADGVAKGDLSIPLSKLKKVQTGIRKLDTIKDHVVFWSSGAKPLELVLQAKSQCHWPTTSCWWCKTQRRNKLCLYLARSSSGRRMARHRN